MTVIPIAPFAPDSPDYPAYGADTVQNVVPSAPNSYGPVPSFSAHASVLDTRCLGAFAARDTPGTSRNYFGTAAKLYRKVGITGTPGDVSKAGGYAAATNRWVYCLYGDRIIATDYVDPIQSYVEGTSTLFADLVTAGVTTLKAKHVAIVKEWLVVINTNDSVVGAKPQRVWWSAVGDPTNFPTPGTLAAQQVESDARDIVGNHGEGRGILPDVAGVDALLFFERAVYAMQYVGPPLFFAHRKLLSFGAWSPGTIVAVGNTAYWLSESGFYAFDGSSVRSIGRGRVDRWLFDRVSANAHVYASSAYDSVSNLIYWGIPSNTTTGELIDRILCYSIDYDMWTVTEAGGATMETIFRALSPGYTIEDLDVYVTIEAVPSPFDSPVWRGGRMIIGGTNASHAIGYLDGPYLEATIDTIDYESPSGNQSRVTEIRPLVDSNAAKVQIGTRDNVSDVIEWGPLTSQWRNGVCPVNSRGRYLRARIVQPAATVWRHCTGVDVVKTAEMGLR